MDEPDRIWRPAMAARVTTFLALPLWVILFVLAAVVDGGRIGTTVLVGLLGLPAAMLASYALRARIVIQGTDLIVVNALRTYRHPLPDVVSGVCGGSGIIFRLRDRRMVSSGVSWGKSLAMRMMHREVFGDRIISEVLERAEQARKREPSPDS